MISHDVHVPPTLEGCNVHLSRVGNHIRAWTWLRIPHRVGGAAILPLTVVGDTPQHAIDNLATAAIRARNHGADSPH